MAESCINIGANNTGGEVNLALPISQLFNVYKLSKYSRVFDSAIGEIFRKYVSDLGWTVSDLLIPENTQKLYAGLKVHLGNVMADKATKEAGNWPISDEAENDLDTILSNFTTFAKDHLRYSNIVNTQNVSLEDLDSIDIDNSTDGDEQNVSVEADDAAQANESGDMSNRYDRPGNDISQVELAASAIKVIPRLLSKSKYNATTRQTEPDYDRDGLPKPVDYIKVWNLLAEQLQGEKDYNDFKTKLLSDKLRRIVPEIDQINEILKTEKPDVLKSKSEVIQFIQFWQSFSKPKIPLQSAFISADGVFTLSDEILGSRAKIETKFNNNFVMGNIPEEYKQYVKKSLTGVNNLMKEGDEPYIPPMDTDYESRMNFLRFLGFRFSGIDYFDPQELATFKDVVNSSAQKLYNSLKKRLEKGTQIKNPIQDLKRKDGKISSEIGAIQALVEQEEKYSTETPTHSSRNGTGELQHLINQDSALTIATYHLNHAKTLKAVMDTAPFFNAKWNPQFKTSAVINFLFKEDGTRRTDKNGNSRRVDLTLLSSFKQKEASGRTNVRLERDLSDKNKIIQDYISFLTQGKTDVMRTETSSSFFSLGMSEGRSNYMWSDPRGFQKSFTKDRAFRGQILNYLNGEIERISTYAAKKKAYPTLPEAYGDFSIFSELSKGLKDKLKVSEPLEMESQMFQDFLSEYNGVLEKELTTFKRMLRDNDISHNNLFSAQLQKIADDELIGDDAFHRAFIAGTLLQNIEFSILYSGDVLFSKEMHKRLKGLASTGSIAADLSLLQTYFSGEEEKNYYNQYSLGGAGVKGKKINARDNTDDFKTQTLQDVVSKNNAYTQPQIIKDIQRSIFLRDRKAISDADAKAIIKSIEKGITTTDGQGWMNLDFYRELAIRHGFITPEMEDVFKYEGLIYRRDIAGHELTEEQTTELERLENKIYADPHLHSAPIVKMTYWGGIRNVKLDAKAYDKFSIAPLMPSYIKNKPQLKQLMLDMVAGQYGYVKHKSGTKMFSTKAVTDIKSAKPDLYSTQLLKEQIKTNSIQKTTTSIPTQQLKVILANMFSNGNGVTKNITKLYERYVNTMKGIQKDQVRKVLNDLAFPFTEENGKFTLGEPNSNILSNKLVSLAKGLQYNSNIITSVSIDPSNGEFNSPPEASGYSKEINSMVAGILDKVLRSFKFAGGDFVIMSNAYQGKLNFYKYSDDGTTAMEIRMTLSKEYSKLLNKIHDDGDPIKTLDRLNKLVANPKWRKENEKALTVILDRVPTDSQHAMGFGIVTEFLPPTMGNVVIMPDEVIFQGGLDFDYDKMKIITPYLDPYGGYVTNQPDAKRLDKVIEKLNELQDIYPDLKNLADIETQDTENYDQYVTKVFNTFVNKTFGTSAVKELDRADNEARALLEEYRNLKTNTDTVRSNGIIETYRDILASPEVFSELIAPNTSEGIKKIALAMGAATGATAELPALGRVLYYTSNLKIFSDYFNAKRELPAFAVSNTHQQVLSQTGVNMNEFFNTLQPERKKGERTQLVMKPERINMILLNSEEKSRVVQHGKILSSLRDDIEGYLKQHRDGEGIAASVDAAKDLFISLLNLSLSNIWVVNTLKTMGVPFDRIMDFINHPALRYYSGLRANGLTAGDALMALAHNRLGLKYINVDETGIVKDSYNYETQMSKEELAEYFKLGPEDTIEHITEGKNYKRIITQIIPIKKSMLLSIFREINNEHAVTDSRFSGPKALMDLNRYLKYSQMTPERLKFLANKANNRTSPAKPLTTEEKIASYSDELRIVAHFMAMEKVSWAAKNFRSYFNFDTAKVSTLTDIRTKDKLRDKIIEEGLYNEEDVAKVENSSVLSAFINNGIISNIYKQLFPVLAKEEVQDGLSFIYQQYESNWKIRNQRDKRNLPYVLDNDFLSSVIFNFGEIQGTNLFDYGEPLIIKRGDKQTMGDKLAEFRQKPYYDELARQYPVLDNFITNKQVINDPNDPNGMEGEVLLDNIQYIKNVQESNIEKEAVIHQLTDLYYNYKGDTDTDTQEIKDFMKDLFITGIVQSGFNKSFISYSEYIPYQFTRKLYKDAIDKFKALDNEKVSTYMSSFANAFEANNPKYFPYIFGDINTNRYSNKFKYYKIEPKTISLEQWRDHVGNVIEEMGGVRPENLTPEPEVKPKEEKKSKKKTDLVPAPIVSTPTVSFEKFQSDMLQNILNVKDSSMDWRITIPTLTQSERERAVLMIGKGKKGSVVNKLVGALKNMYAAGVIDVNRGRGNAAESRSISINDYYDVVNKATADNIDNPEVQEDLNKPNDNIIDINDNPIDPSCK